MLRVPAQPAGTVVVGISGARRNAAAAIAVDGRLGGFCEEERITRIRGAALPPGALPQGAVDAALHSAGRERDAVTTYVAGEVGLSIPDGLPLVRLDHHHAHAATAFLTSPFEKAAVLVCDSHASPEVTVWLGLGDELTRKHWTWDVQGFASLFSECSRLFGFPDGSEHRLEALARLGRGDEVERAARLFRYANGEIRIDSGWKAAIEAWLHENGGPWSLEHGALVASAVQRALGDALLALVADIRRSLDVPSSVWAEDCSTTRSSTRSWRSPAFSTGSTSLQIPATPASPRVRRWPWDEADRAITTSKASRRSSDGVRARANQGNAGQLQAVLRVPVIRRGDFDGRSRP